MSGSLGMRTRAGNLMELFSRDLRRMGRNWESMKMTLGLSCWRSKDNVGESSFVLRAEIMAPAIGTAK